MAALAARARGHPVNERVLPFAAGAALIVLGASPPPTAPGSEPAPEPVALVAVARGELGVCEPSAERCWAETWSPLSPFDWLAPATRLELAPAATLQLLLLDGRRFELRGPVSARLRGDGVELLAVPRRSPLAGPALRALPATAAPDVLAIAAEERPAPRLGAIRLRNGGIRNLLPHEETTTLAEATVLSFTPAAGGARYVVSVLDPAGRTVFTVETGDHRLALPAAALRPGTTYLWRVVTVGRAGATLRGEAEFRTLGQRTVRARERLRRALLARPGSGDAAARLALAEVDRRLGLVNEAAEGAAAAAAMAPGDAALQAAAERIRQH
jgi:hypothetical protein